MEHQEYAADLDEETADVPEDFFCPITQMIMIDPVTTVDGISYEHTAIARWLRPGRMSSPSTGRRLDFPTLTPNHALRNVIENWLAHHHKTQERRVQPRSCTPAAVVNSACACPHSKWGAEISTIRQPVFFYLQVLVEADLAFAIQALDHKASMRQDIAHFRAQMVQLRSLAQQMQQVLGIIRNTAASYSSSSKDDVGAGGDGGCDHEDLKENRVRMCVYVCIYIETCGSERINHCTRTRTQAHTYE